MLKSLLTNSKFWVALIALLQAILFYFVPTFPEIIWTAIDALLAVIIGTMAVNDARAAKKE